MHVQLIYSFEVGKGSGLAIVNIIFNTLGSIEFTLFCWVINIATIQDVTPKLKRGAENICSKRIK